MIDQLRAMAIFASVAEEGSFSAAGRKLKITTSVISHHVSNLEQRLGVNLLYRSTRSLSLTDEGRKLLVSAQRMIEAAEYGLDQIAGDNEPAGALTLTMPGFVMNSPYEASIWDFARQYPKVAITLRTHDRHTDLIGEGYDLAIRLGEMRNSSLRSRRLGSFVRKLVCAPSYLARNGPVDSLDDLRRCEFVRMEMLPDIMVLEQEGTQVEIASHNSRIQVNSVVAALSAVMSGIAIQRLPLTAIQSELEKGLLVELLPEWKLPILGVFAVWPETGKGNLTRRLLDHLEAV